MSDDWTHTLDRTFDSSSGVVRWGVLGPEDGPPVVLPHGTPWSSYTWRGLARALALRSRVHVWDMPGHGTSQKYDGQDVSLAAQGRIFAELLQHWGLHGDDAGESRRPAVLAHDFGGCAALRAHLLHGARYARLALVDVVALAPWGSPSYRLLGGHSEVFEQRRQRRTRRWYGSTSGRPAPRDSARRCWTGSSRRGSARTGSAPSTGRSPGTTSAGRTRSRAATGSWRCPC